LHVFSYRVLSLNDDDSRVTCDAVSYADVT